MDVLGEMASPSSPLHIGGTKTNCWSLPLSSKNCKVSCGDRAFVGHTERSLVLMTYSMIRNNISVLYDIIWVEMVETPKV